MCERWLWRWAPLSLWALLENLGEGSYAGDLCVEEGSGTGVSPYRGPVGGPEDECPSTGNFERWMKGAIGMGRLCLKRLTAEGLEGGLLYWIPWVMKGRLWGRASLFMGAQMGNLELAPLPGTLRDGCKGLWKWGASVYRRSMKGTWREGFLAVDPGG